MTAADRKFWADLLRMEISYEERQERMRTRWPKSRDLEKLLLSLGGEKVVLMPPDADGIDDLLRRGRAFMPTELRMARGNPGECHANAAKLWTRRWRRERGFRIVTGYALSEDGRWRQHSWGWQGGAWIETTEKRVIGFGVALEGDEAARWAMVQYDQFVTDIQDQFTAAEHQHMRELVIQVFPELADPTRRPGIRNVPRSEEPSSGSPGKPSRA